MQQALFDEYRTAFVDVKPSAIEALSLVEADVIATEDERTLRIGAGNRALIEVGMPVIGVEGLVGFITDVGEDDAKVEMLTSQHVTVASFVQRTLDSGIGCGTEDGMCEIKYLPSGVQLQEGDFILTSGEDLRCAANIIVGTIADAGKQFVIPAVDFLRLSRVCVIRG